MSKNVKHNLWKLQQWNSKKKTNVATSISPQTFQGKSLQKLVNIYWHYSKGFDTLSCLISVKATGNLTTILKVSFGIFFLLTISFTTTKFIVVHGSGKASKDFIIISLARSSDILESWVLLHIGRSSVSKPTICYFGETL